MNFPGFWRDSRLKVIAATFALGVVVSGCQTDGIYSAKHLKPLSAEMVALLEKKGMDKTSPILVRAFKEESELEVWKKDASGKFALLKTYPICRWSGELGPKIREGDRQAPEGFYTITPGQMNPNSSFYLSFNLGYPNAFDRAHGRTGSHLMVHGDCSSRGCYSMTDEQIAEIFALGREAFFGGQRAFQVQAYPFRMTPLNMAKHRNSPHLAFWKNLKEGNDHFEVLREEPKVGVCEKRYVFNANTGALSPTGPCPALNVDPGLAAQVAAKTRRDELAFAEYVRRNTPTVPIRTGRDGGMHPVFLAKLKGKQEIRDENGDVRVVSGWDAPGTVPAHAVPPRDAPIVTASADPEASFAPSAGAASASGVPMPRPAPRSAAARASANAYAPRPAEGGNLFTNLFTSSAGSVDKASNSVARVLGFGGEQSQPQPAKPAPRPSQARPAPRPAPATAKPAAPAPAKTAQAAPPANRNSGLVAGAQPVLPSGGFESRAPAAR